jgi:hypothetical protein
MAWRIHKLQHPHRLVHIATGEAMGYGEAVFVNLWGMNLDGGRVLDSQGNTYIPVIETPDWAFHVGVLRHPLAANDSITFEGRLDPPPGDEAGPLAPEEQPLVVAIGFATGVFSAEAAETMYQIAKPGAGKDDGDEVASATADAQNAGC